jgi:alkanesulfonate monooxygenase SsuD/methylene tetrahydromethanopterin reductase-like flavin-dependent oxidoreductase (luciferase family)
MAQSDVSIGLAGALGPEAVARIAPAVEQAGFGTLWVNDTPGGDSLAALGAASRTTERLRLGTGVIPVDRRRPTEIIAGIQRAELPEDRLVLGVGSGRVGRGALALMADAVGELREGSRASVLVGALGPRMRELAVRRADGVLLNWLTPDAARAQAAEAHGLAPSARVALYVRTALESAAGDRLAKEAGRYDGSPKYAANFDRLGFRAVDTVLDAATFADRIGSYREAVDEIVLRVIVADDSVDAYLRFVDAAAALIRRA